MGEASHSGATHQPGARQGVSSSANANGGKRMKKLLLAAALSTAIIAPAAASAQDPAPAKNAAKYCKQLRSEAGGANFVSMFGTKKNAYGKCVSQTAKK